MHLEALRAGSVRGTGWFSIPMAWCRSTTMLLSAGSLRRRSSAPATLGCGGSRVSVGKASGGSFGAVVGAAAGVPVCGCKVLGAGRGGAGRLPGCFGGVFWVLSKGVGSAGSMPFHLKVGTCQRLEPPRFDLRARLLVLSRLFGCCTPGEPRSWRSSTRLS